MHPHYPNFALQAQRTLSFLPVPWQHDRAVEHLFRRDRLVRNTIKAVTTDIFGLRFNGLPVRWNQQLKSPMELRPQAAPALLADMDLGGRHVRHPDALGEGLWCG